jgi:hypothetical protein
MNVLIDLPLPSSATPTVAIRGPWPTESAVENSPFSLSGSSSSNGRFSASVGELAAGLYRCDVTLSGTLIAIGYISTAGTETNVRMVDDPSSAIDYTALADSIAPAVSSAILSTLLNRFTISGTVGESAMIATNEITREERIALGPMYVGNYYAYTQADLSLSIGTPTTAADCVGRLVWTAKNQISDADSAIVLQVDSGSGLVKPTGFATSGTIAAIPNATAGQPARAAKVDIRAIAQASVNPGRLYWDLRRYIAQNGQTPAEADLLATGILDLSRPVNRSTS